MVWKMFYFLIVLCVLVIPQVQSGKGVKTTKTAENTTALPTVTLSSLSLAVNECKQKNLIDADVLGSILRVEIPDQERNVLCAIACVFTKFNMTKNSTINATLATKMYRLFEIPSITNATIGIIVKDCASELNASQYHWRSAFREASYLSEEEYTEYSNKSTDMAELNEYDPNEIDEENEEQPIKNNTDEYKHILKHFSDTRRKREKKKLKWKRKLNLDQCDEVNKFLKCVYNKKIENGIFRN